MPDAKLEIAVLTIKASPHPDGIYPRLLRGIANVPILLWGQDFVALKPPERIEGGFYRGQILVWTELDPNAPAVNKETLEAVTLDEAGVHIGSNTGINLRVFLYVLRERDHLIFYEQRNETGHHLGPYRLMKPFEKLFYDINSRGEMTVDVDVVPEEDALEKVLAISRIGILEIHLKKPNADDNTPDAAEIMQELEEQGAHKKDIKLKASDPKKGITPNARTRVEAEAAAENGYVKATGKEGGKKVVRSTEEYPKVITTILPALASARNVLFQIAKDTIFRRRRPRGPSA